MLPSQVLVPGGAWAGRVIGTDAPEFRNPVFCDVSTDGGGYVTEQLKRHHP